MYKIFAKLLEENGVTPDQVSKATGVAQSSLSDWKNGKSKPKFEKMKKIADYFGVSVDYLMYGEEKNSQQELSSIYLSFAKDAQQNKIDPEDIRLAIETIKALRAKQQED